MQRRAVPRDIVEPVEADRFKIRLRNPQQLGCAQQGPDIPGPHRQFQPAQETLAQGGPGHHPVFGSPVLESRKERRGSGQNRRWRRLPATEYRILYLSREMSVRPEISTTGTAPPGGMPLTGGERSGLYSRPCQRPVPLHTQPQPVRDSGGERKQGAPWKIRRPILSPGLYSRAVGTLLARLGLIPGTLLA